MPSKTNRVTEILEKKEVTVHDRPNDRPEDNPFKKKDAEE